MDNSILKYFAFAHLPPHLQGVSGDVYALAMSMNAQLPESAEKSAGLRKLLEAKDCFVRAALHLRDEAAAVVSSEPDEALGDQPALLRQAP